MFFKAFLWARVFWEVGNAYMLYPSNLKQTRIKPAAAVRVRRVARKRRPTSGSASPTLATPRQHQWLCYPPPLPSSSCYQHSTCGRRDTQHSVYGCQRPAPSTYLHTCPMVDACHSSHGRRPSPASAAPVPIIPSPPAPFIPHTTSSQPQPHLPHSGSDCTPGPFHTWPFCWTLAHDEGRAGV